MKKKIIFFALASALLFASCEPENKNEDLPPEVISGEMVDLGLSVYWCSHNLGAATPWDNGYSYKWGEVTPSDRSGGGYWAQDVPEVIVGTTHDPAVKYGPKWRMPTRAEVEELCSKCVASDYYYEEDGQTYQMVKLTAPNGNYIYLRRSGKKPYPGFGPAILAFGWYWTGTSDTDENGRHFYCLEVASGRDGAGACLATDDCDAAIPIRPVQEKQ